MSIDLLLKEYKLETANVVRAQIDEKCNDCNSHERQYLSLTIAICNASLESISFWWKIYYVSSGVKDWIYLFG